MADMHTPLRIAEVMKEEAVNGAACGWRSCTGCHETNEGAETGFYPYSSTFGCYVGSGCSECGGIGVTWEHYSKEDLDAMGHDIDAPPAPAPSHDAETVKALREALTEAAGTLECLSHIHDRNPSDARADMAPVDYARHMLFEARQIAKAAHSEARAALAGSAS